MNVIKCFFRTVLWSIGISIGIRIVFGLYSVFGAIVLIIPIVLALIASFSLATSSNFGFTAVSMIHMILTTGFYAFFDVSGLFRTLASDSAEFFSRFAGADEVRTNLLWCILFVMPVYFFCFIVISSIIASVKAKQRMLDDPDEYYDSEDTDRVSYRK